MHRSSCQCDTSLDAIAIFSRLIYRAAMSFSVFRVLIFVSLVVPFVFLYKNLDVFYANKTNERIVWEW